MAETTNQRTATEALLDPDLAICDPHHHLRERPNDRYFLEEFIQDTHTGHNVVATVCVENRAMYRKDGPENMKPVGETEFFDSVAAQTAANPNISTRVAAGIVDRCMFESNFPVDKTSYSYVAIWNAFKRITQRYSAAERQALFHDTAARVYRLAINKGQKQAG